MPAMHDDPHLVVEGPALNCNVPPPTTLEEHVDGTCVLSGDLPGFFSSFAVWGRRSYSPLPYENGRAWRLSVQGRYSSLSRKLPSSKRAA